MDHTASVRRSVAAALATHGPHIAGAMGLAVIALIVLPFDGPVAQFGSGDDLVKCRCCRRGEASATLAVM
jgi:hypothetical protein